MILGPVDPLLASDLKMVMMTSLPLVRGHPVMEEVSMMGSLMMVAVLLRRYTQPLAGDRGIRLVMVTVVISAF